MGLCPIHQTDLIALLLHLEDLLSDVDLPGQFPLPSSGAVCIAQGIFLKANSSIFSSSYIKGGEPIPVVACAIYNSGIRKY